MRDVIVIGGGPGGYAAAIRASQVGGAVTLVESGELGGTCVNRGCIPSKVWLRAAKLIRNIQGAKDFGVHASIEKVDHSVLVTRKNGVAGGIRMGMEGLLKNNSVEVVRGRGMIKNPGEVDVDGKTLEGKSIIIATGSRVSVPEIPGLKEAALTTDELFDLTDLPSSALVLGGGPIEVEVATLLQTLGCAVTLATDAPRILPREDPDAGQRIGAALRAQGVELLTRTSLIGIKKSGSGFAASLSGDKSVNVDRVVVCSRRPNSENMGLENLGITTGDDGSIAVNERLETSKPGVYAIGDVTGGWMLSHAASSMAVVAAENAMGADEPFPFHLIPRGIWTTPELGAVGLTEEEAEAQGYEVKVGDFPYSINAMAMLRGEVDGSVKIIADAQYEEILGAHIVGAHATEVIGEAVTAMQMESTLTELARSIRVHPTFSEPVVDAARAAQGWALYLPKR